MCSRSEDNPGSAILNGSELVHVLTNFLDTEDQAPFVVSIWDAGKTGSVSKVGTRR